MLGLFLALSPQIGVWHDSVFYLKSAENLLSGNGLGIHTSLDDVRPLVHFPPLYPLLLAALSGITGLSVTMAAKILAVLLLGANAMLAALLIWKITQNVAATLITCFGMTMLHVIVNLHLLAMSEPLFILLMLLFLLSLYRHVALQQKLKHLIWAAVFGALAWLAHYAGGVLLPIGILALILMQTMPFKRKIIQSAIFSGIFILPNAVWMIRNLVLTGITANRTLNLHLPWQNNPTFFGNLKSVISKWFFPSFIPDWLSLAFIGALMAGMLGFVTLTILRTPHGDKTPTQRERNIFVAIMLLVIFCVVYATFILASISLFDASTPLDDRILFPVVLGGFLLAVMLVFSHIPRYKTELYQWLVLGLFAAFILQSGIRSTIKLVNLAGEGTGFSAVAWQTSPTLQFVATLPAETYLASNQSFALYYVLNRPTVWLPEGYDPVKAQPNDNYDATIANLRLTLLERQGALVIFQPYDTAIFPPIGVLTNGMIELGRFEDGVVYAFPDNLHLVP